MNAAFRRSSDVMGVFITYSDIFNRKPTVEEVIGDIRKIEIKKALTIISNYNLYTDKQKNELIKRLHPFIGTPFILENKIQAHVFDIINLTYSLKMFLAYGTEKPVNNFNNSIDDFGNVLMTIFKISDLMEDSVDDDIQVQQTFQKLMLVNRDKSFLPTIARQQIFFNEIAKNRILFGSEFVDIHTYFEAEYGYTIQDYLSVLASVCANIESRTQGLDDKKLIGVSVDYFKTTKKQEIAQAIFSDITADLSVLKKQANQSLANIYDNEFLISKPFFEYDNHYVLFSPPLLNLGLFDSVCFKLQRICQKYKKDFFTFFGRLFEQYAEFILGNVTKKAKGISYEFIPEYKYTPGKDSSDAYIRLGKNLLIIECKGGRITKEAKINADLTNTEDNFQKYVIKPIKQANEAFENILKLDPQKFSGVKKVYILSVTLQRFPKLPMYHERLQSELQGLHPTIVHYDYMSLLDLEVIIAYIEKQKKSVFKFIEDKKYYHEYLSYEHYYAKKYGEVPYLTMHKQQFFSSIEKILENLNQNDIEFTLRKVAQTTTQE